MLELTVIIFKLILISFLFSIQTYSSEVKEFYPYAKNRQVMIHSDLLAKCMADAIRKSSQNQEISLLPSLTYSNEFYYSRSDLEYSRRCAFNRDDFFTIIYL